MIFVSRCTVAILYLSMLFSCQSFDTGSYMLKRKTSFRRLEQKIFRQFNPWHTRKNKIEIKDPEIAKLYREIERQKAACLRKQDLPDDLDPPSPLAGIWRPENEDWQFHDNGTLCEDMERFDYKKMPYRKDMMGGCDPDMTYGKIDEKELENIDVMLTFFKDLIEVLEASNGVFRFKYHGLVKNLIGMQSEATCLIKENHPNPDSVKEVLFVTLKKSDLNRGNDMH